MTTTQQSASPRTAATSIRAQLSPRLVAVAATATVAGLLTGTVQYLHRSPVRVRHSAGTAAWTPQLALLAAALVLLVVARVWNHRRRSGRLLVLAPLGRSAQARLQGAGGSAGRAVVAALPVTLCAYGVWRVGEQVTAGLDSNFTADAWGGPGYLGAMFCHDLDVGLIIAASAAVLTLVLPRPGSVG